jgi:hypothetical protein
MPRPHEFCDTDFVLPYFVAWDTKPTRENRIAKHEARFDCEKEAIAFYDAKGKQRSLFVWRGCLGVSKTVGFDWMHITWTKNCNGNDGEPPKKNGVAVAWSNWKEVSYTPLPAIPKV